MNIRDKIKSPATDLCSYVVNTCIEFKEELLKLEKENLELVRKNEHLKIVNSNLVEQNRMLLEELEISQNRICEMIKRFGINNVCYNCDHFLDCGDNYLCIYCKKWVCNCCTEFCRQKLGTDRHGDDICCSITLCDSCANTHNRCPSHSDLNEELVKELTSYYKENRFRKF